MIKNLIPLILVFFLSNCSFMIESDVWDKKIKLHKDYLKIGKTFILTNSGDKVLVKLPDINTFINTKGYFPIYHDIVLPSNVLSDAGVKNIDKLSYAYPSFILIEQTNDTYDLNSGGNQSFRKIINKSNSEVVTNDFDCKLTNLLKPKDYKEKDIEKFLQNLFEDNMKDAKGLTFKNVETRKKACKDPNCRMTVGLYESIHYFYKKNYLLPIYRCKLIEVVEPNKEESEQDENRDDKPMNKDRIDEESEDKEASKEDSEMEK